MRKEGRSLLDSHRAGIVYHPGLLKYDFGMEHPLRPERIVLGLDLLERTGIWQRESETVTARESPVEELQLIHSLEYIRAVQGAGEGTVPAVQLAAYGIGRGDNPAFPGMHAASALVAGGCAEGARRILAGEVDHVFHPTGGLHHALRDRASGFCIYDDPALAIAIILEQTDFTVLYVDFDCHHGDGVQWLFYDEPRVMTMSFHESGNHLFPGTGGIYEVGVGDGVGFSVNVPFAPYTGDSSWMSAVQNVLPALAAKFRPDFIVSCHGADTHIWDPLTHIALTTNSFVDQAALIHEMAHQYCSGRWIAMGSGGYDWRRVVPRSWAIVWSEMSCRPLPELLPESWLSKWQNTPGEPLPDKFLDDQGISSNPGSERVAKLNANTVADLRRVLEF